jgi:hypothetical protein
MEGATLYVPPKERPKLDSDMVEKLHMQSETRS